MRRGRRHRHQPANADRAQINRRRDAQHGASVRAPTSGRLRRRRGRRALCGTNPRPAELGGWFKSPAYLKNGHAHTIFAAKFRWTASVVYRRHLLTTSDGGSLALDIVDKVSDETSKDSTGATYVDGAVEEDASPFLLLLSGLGGGSQDTYVRAQAAAAVERGWKVGVLNMRSCGGSPVTSPRFFSARHGSVEDVRTATAWIRTYVQPTSLCAIGWSNSGTIVCNALSEPDSLIDAACCLAAPLDMPSSSANFERPFHRNVYDRAIGGSLAEKFRTAQHLFVDAAGRRSSRVPAYFGGDFVADVEKASTACTIRAVDEALTAPCFGFPSVDAYYADASADQRVKDIGVPLLIMNAADDPIAQYNMKEGVFDAETLAANPNLVVAVTATGAIWAGATPRIPDAAARRAGRRAWLWIFWRRRARRRRLRSGRKFGRVAQMAAWLARVKQQGRAPSPL